MNAVNELTAEEYLEAYDEERILIKVRGHWRKPYSWVEAKAHKGTENVLLKARQVELPMEGESYACRYTDSPNPARYNCSGYMLGRRIALHL